MGKSSEGRLAPLAPAGHPHAGGEICQKRTRANVHGGPSPRGWGNLMKLAKEGFPTRAIPTRVGKSSHTGTHADSPSGHPHAGGEIRSNLYRGITTAGPSPRGWGNLGGRAENRRSQRAIPTRVGKSFSSSSRARRGSGHPHAGGEIQELNAHGGRVTGPSPRGWGNPSGCGVFWLGQRAIPTRVGKSAHQ